MRLPSPRLRSPRLRSPRLRTLAAAAAVLLPSRVRRAVHVRLLGHAIHPTARLGRSFVDVDHLVMGEDAVIGSLNVIRGCTDVVLGTGAVILPLNWVNAVRPDRGYFSGIDRHPALLMGEGSLITNLHVLDACDRIELADYAAIAGFGSIVQTHAADVERMRQGCSPVTVGHHSLVTTRCVLLPGAAVPPASVVAAGSVVTGVLTERPHLFGGVPAKPLRPTDPTAAFFTRQTSQLW